MIEKFPPKIRIKPRTAYEVIWNSNLGEGEHLGEMRPISKQLALQTGRPKDETISTFIHEVLHAADIEYKLNLSHKQVYGLEKAVFNILKLNGWLPDV